MSNVIKEYPALAEAINDAASPQIRNMATLGGNLCQRPRCWYFRGGFGLLPKSESGKDLVVNGENRYHAILGKRRSGEVRQPLVYCSGAHRLWSRASFDWAARNARTVG